VSELNVSVTLQMAADQFDAAIAKIAQDFKQAMGDMNAAAGQAGAGMARLLSSVREVENALAGLGSAIGSLSGAVSDITAFAASIVNMHTAVAAFKSVIEAGLGFEKLNAALTVATGSSAAAAQEFAFIKETADTLGLGLNGAAAAYVKLAAAGKGTALEGENTRRIFTGVMQAAGALKLEGDEVSGMFQVIGRMAGTSTVDMDALRGQLGERLPDAFNIAARSMGMTGDAFDKLVSSGKLTTDEFLPKFAAGLQNTFGAAAATAAQSLSANLNRITDSWEQFKLAIAQSGAMDALNEGLKSLLSTIQALADSGELQKMAQEMADAIGKVVSATVAVIKVMVQWRDELVFLARVLIATRLVEMGLELLAFVRSAGAAATSASTLAGVLGKLPRTLQIAILVFGYEVLKAVGIWLGESIAKLQGYKVEAEKAGNGVAAGMRVAAAATKVLRDTTAETAAAINSYNNMVVFAKVGESAEQAQARVAAAKDALVNAFEELKASGKTTQEALKHVYDGLKTGNFDAVRAALSALDELEKKGKITGSQLRGSLDDFLKKLSVDDLIKFQINALAAFDGTAAGAQRMAGAMEASLKAVLGKIGVDQELIRTGFSKLFSDAEQALTAVVDNIAATTPEIKAAFDKMLDAAKTQKELAAVGEELRRLEATGKQTGQELADSQARLQAKIRETAGQVEGALGDAFKRMGVKSTEAIRATAEQASVDYVRIRDSGVAAPTEIEKAFKKTQEAVKAAIATMTGDSQKHLDKVKELTAAVQIAATATAAKGKAVEASANAQKAETDYANASAEASKSGSAAAKAKADALGLAAQAAQAEADAAQAGAQAADDAAKAAKDEATAKEANALYAKYGTESTRAMAAEAQINANYSAATAETSKQAATEASAMAGELRSSANAAMTLAGTVKDAADSMSKFKKEAYDAQGYLLDAEGKKFESATMTAEGFADAIKKAKEEVLKLAEPMDAMINREVEAARQVVNAGVDGANAFLGADQKVQGIAQQLAKTELAQRRNTEAATAWKSALTAAKLAAADIKTQLDQALGRFEQVENADFEAKLRALEDEMAANRKAGNGAAVGELAQAMASLRQLHQIKLANIAKEKAAQIAAEKEQNAQAAADKAAALQEAVKSEANARAKSIESAGKYPTAKVIDPTPLPSTPKPQAVVSIYQPVYKGPDLSVYLPKEFTQYQQAQQAQQAARSTTEAAAQPVTIKLVAPGGASVTGNFGRTDVEAMLAVLKSAGARAVPA